MDGSHFSVHGPVRVSHRRLRSNNRLGERVDGDEPLGRAYVDPRPAQSSPKIDPGGLASAAIAASLSRTCSFNIVVMCSKASSIESVRWMR